MSRPATRAAEPLRGVDRICSRMRGAGPLVPLHAGINDAREVAILVIDGVREVPVARATQDELRTFATISQPIGSNSAPRSAKKISASGKPTAAASSVKM
jgi:hypothetical protein